MKHIASHRNHVLAALWCFALGVALASPPPEIEAIPIRDALAGQRCSIARVGIVERGSDGSTLIAHWHFNCTQAQDFENVRPHTIEELELIARLHRQEL